MKLQDKIILITGGSSGIGKAMVYAFSKEGSTVIFTYNAKEQEAENIAQETNSLAIKVDLHNESDIESLFQTISKKYGKLDVLINNAGINTSDELDLTIWRDIFEVNVFAVVSITEKAIKLMKNGCKILNTSSIYAEGKAAFTGKPAYDASKAAISNFTQVLAKRVAPKILVNAIAPGYVRTPLWDKKNRTEGDFAEYGKEQLIERMIQPEEIAEMAVTIVKSDAMTGEVVVVDGGISLKTI